MRKREVDACCRMTEPRVPPYREGTFDVRGFKPAIRRVDVRELLREHTTNRHPKLPFPPREGAGG